MQQYLAIPKLLYLTVSVLVCRSETYPGVAVQETAGGDGVQECLVCCDNVVQVLGLLYSVPKLIPGALENLKEGVETWGGPTLLKAAPLILLSQIA